MLPRSWLRLTAFLAFQALFSTSFSSEPSTPPQTTSAHKSVRVETLKEKIVPEWGEFHGFVRSRHRVDIIAQIMGRVKAVHVGAGQKVNAGDVLIELDATEWQAKLAAAESRKAAAEATAIEAEQYNDRIKVLRAQGAATQQELDVAVSRWKSAKAAVDAAQAQVAESREFLGYTVLRSPVTGIVVDKRVNPGDFSMPGLAQGQSFASGPTLMTIYDPAALWFEGSIPERYSSVVTVGTKAWLSLASGAAEVEGRFVEVVPGVDESARTFITRVDLTPSPLLKLGMFGRVRFVTGERHILEIPVSSLISRGQLDTAFVVADGRARLRLVRVGRRSPDHVEILAGLKAGESLVLDPPDTLRDGDTITPDVSKP
jgi:RND family efflux transporter MFP subunit